jgi:hypothetical protein
MGLTCGRATRAVFSRTADPKGGASMNPLSPFLETLKNHMLNTVWPALDDSYTPEQPEVTYNGTPIPPTTKGLPKIVESLCPECDKTRCIPARMFEEDGKVFMEKTCPEHGFFKEL